MLSIRRHGSLAPITAQPFRYKGAAPMRNRATPRAGAKPNKPAEVMLLVKSEETKQWSTATGTLCKGSTREAIWIMSWWPAGTDCQGQVP